MVIATLIQKVKYLNMLQILIVTYWNLSDRYWQQLKKDIWVTTTTGPYRILES